MLRFKLFFVFASALLLNAFVGLSQDDEKYSVGDKEQGKASYYGEKMHGKVTASGEIYDMFAMTAAHRELPFNTIIKVTNLNEPDKWVTLRINDRGPFSKNRILDISKRAALKLNMEKTGVLEVEIEVLKVGDNKTLNATPKPNSSTAQQDSTKNDKDAEGPIAKDKSKSDKAKEKEDEAIAQKENKAKTESKPNKEIANLPLEKRFNDVGTYNTWGTPVSKSGYGIQLASYGEIKKALEVAKEVKSLGLSNVNIESGWSNGQHSYRVIWGAWDSKDEAESNLNIAIKKGFPSAFAKAHLGTANSQQKAGKD